jgi:hypothetical protein
MISIMKTRISTFVIFLLALFNFSVAQAQKANPHFNKQDPPSYTGTSLQDGKNTNFQICAKGTVYGLGNYTEVEAYIVVEGSGDVFCFNKGQDTGPVQGQTNKEYTSSKTSLPVENGHASIDELCVKITGGCRGGGMDYYTVTSFIPTKITVFINGSELVYYP